MTPHSDDASLLSRSLRKTRRYRNVGTSETDAATANDVGRVEPELGHAARKGMGRARRPISPASNSKSSFSETAPAAAVPRQICAIEVYNRFPSSTKPRLMRGEDGRLYVVKFATDRVSSRAAINELLAWQLAREIGLLTPEAALIQIPQGLRAPSGIHFGSHFEEGRSTYDWLPQPAWWSVQNPTDIVGSFCFDAWTSNVDVRQLIFVRNGELAEITVKLIDNAHCFCGPQWMLADLAPMWPTEIDFAYADVRGWSDLEPWLSRIEQLPPERIRRARQCLPESWLTAAGPAALNFLLEALVQRTQRTRELVATRIGRGDHPFRNWRFGSALYVASRSTKASG